jgi:hypothetical protein
MTDVAAKDLAAVRMPIRAEKLDPFKSYIVGRRKAALPDRIPATVLFREIKDQGYDGDAREAVCAGIDAAASRYACGSLRDRAGSSDAGRLGADKLSLFSDAWGEPPGICRVPRRRAGR